MTIPGLEYGIDASRRLLVGPAPRVLTHADWVKIRNWRGDPMFAGRYFDAKPGHEFYWLAGEAVGVKAEDPALRYVFPIQSGVNQGVAAGVQTATTLQDTEQHWTPDAYVGTEVRLIFGPGSPQNRAVTSNTRDTLTVVPPWAPANPNNTTRYALGKRPNKLQGWKDDGSPEPDRARIQAWGADDAKSICRRILQVVAAGDLKLPKSRTVIVYLDVEWNWYLSPDYWYGWASTVYWYCNGGFQLPFLPGLYCPTMHDPDQPGGNDQHRIPDLNVVATPRSLADAGWVKTNMAVALDQSGVDGVANTASSLRATAANATCLRSVTLPEAKRYQSAWLKRLNGNGDVHMTMDGGVTWTLTKPQADGKWHRRSIPRQTIENPTVGFRVATSGDKIAVELPGDVHLGLTERPNNLASVCHGIYASPIDPNGTPQAFRPDWTDRFDVWQQTVHVVFGWIAWNSGVPVRLWQYAIQSSPPDPVFVSGVDVDLDETSPHAGCAAAKYMLELP